MSKSISKLENFKEVMNKLQIPYILYLCDGPNSVSYDASNEASVKLFGYDSIDEFSTLKIENVFGWVDQCDVNCVRSKLGVLDNNWIKLDANRKDGSKIPIGINAVDFIESGNNYILAIMRDRTEAVRSEADLDIALNEASNLKNMAESARCDAEKARDEALGSKLVVEQNLNSQKKLNSQIEFLKFSLKGIMGLIVMLCIMVLIGWHSSKFDKDSLAMFERILLVLVGMLSTSASGVFDKKSSDQTAPLK